jgi:hypothetical protein
VDLVFQTREPLLKSRRIKSGKPARVGKGTWNTALYLVESLARG